MHEYKVKIPLERVGVLIGTDGETKAAIEEVSNTELDVDSDDGIVTIYGDAAIDLYETKDVVKAIGRGFNPDIAQTLLRQDHTLDVIDVTTVVSDGQVERAKGRVIGKDGKTRRRLEGMTDTFLSVFGKTVAVIGEIKRVEIVREGIVALLQGAQHGTVYEDVQDAMQELQKRELLNT